MVQPVPGRWHLVGACFQPSPRKDNEISLSEAPLLGQAFGRSQRRGSEHQSHPCSSWNQGTAPATPVFGAAAPEPSTQPGWRELDAGRPPATAEMVLDPLTYMGLGSHEAFPKLHLPGTAETPSQITGCSLKDAQRLYPR